MTTIKRDPDGRWSVGTRVEIYDGRQGVIVGRSKRRWHAYRVLLDGETKPREFGSVATPA